MFENGCTHKEVEKQFPYFYKTNAEKINLLFKQVNDERFNRDPTLIIEKDTDLYKSRQYQIELIEKRRKLKNVMKRSERHKKYDG
jgi:hypothetical protein